MNAWILSSLSRYTQVNLMKTGIPSRFWPTLWTALSDWSLSWQQWKVPNLKIVAAASCVLLITQKVGIPIYTMGRFLALPALLAICTVLVEGHFLKRESELMWSETARVPTCPEIVSIECIEKNLGKYQPIFSSEEMAVVSLKNRTLLDALASDLKKADECLDVEFAKPTCAGESDEEWDPLRLMADFADSPERLDLIVAAMDSPCLINEAAAERAGMSLFMCYMTFLEEFQRHQNICQAFDGLETCSVTATATNCGTDAGDLVQSIWDFVETPEVRNKFLSMTEMEEVSGMINACYPQASLVRRFAKRALTTWINRK
ncbi:hypothetical protein ElyMa_004640600 [Elysia marginata]|uniref:Uncharacterized protein n=1 Tax=Elysia marginata TaxID=1093978 RepID=A0AAV4HZT5_9GAST|nr:hypothetical protein ElyMa_004640600 [Elysia marginata]